MTLNKKNKILNNLLKQKYLGYSYMDELKIENNSKADISLPDDLDKLNTMIDNCSLCNLSKKGHNSIELTNVSDILFVSIFKLGLASDAGKLFTSMIEKVLNLNISDINLISVIKCKSTDDENNIISEIDICKPYVMKQIDILNPKIIIPLGNCFKFILNNTNYKDISSARGSLFRYNNSKVIPLYDPSDILQNPSLKKDVFMDLKKIKLVMDEN